MIDKTYILHFSESSIIFLVLTETARPSSSNRQRKFVDLAPPPRRHPSQYIQGTKRFTYYRTD
ncbi:hypothetical protein NYE27_28090 [Paenibacillus sp. FSL R10-2779]|uniref:hypothetical protein n=1 Tax=Paenibacillus sp. FSL R10-2779 TaxID=2975340 RepID=UPI0030FB82AA